MSKLAVWPYVFTLRTASLVGAYRRDYGTTEAVAAKSARAPVAATGGAASLGIPVALRWMTTPELGFPRRPFNVYRRARSNIPARIIRNLLPAPATINGTVNFPFSTGSNGLMYLVAFSLVPASNSILDVVAYDLFGNAIPSLKYDIWSAATGLFVGPGIAGLRISGSGSVTQILAVNEDDYANLPDWQLIQVVGLPAKKGELGTAYADTVRQGYEFALTDGFTAAEERLLISNAVRGLPPGTGDPSFPLPPWPFPNALGYLNNLRSTSNLFPMIAQCLTNSVDANAAKMQSLYTQTANVDGIKQANMPGATPGNPSTVTIPVVGVSMLAVSTDCDAATALGYGTIDIPGWDTSLDTPPAQAGAFATDRAAVVAYDYMVTAPYVLPYGITVDLAALSQAAPAVQDAVGFNADLLATHAVLARDAAAQVAVRLSWQPPTYPQAYALLASRQASTSAVLNAARPATVHGYYPYVGLPPGSPDPTTPPNELIPNLTDAAGQLPIDGSATTRYLAAGIDVFGQWSGWTKAQVTLTAAAIRQPGLRKAVLDAGALPASGTVVPYTLTIDILWDWTDRAPGVIRISGQFIAPGMNLGPAYLAGLALSNDAPPGAPLLLTWNYGANDPATVAPGAVLPAVDANHTATVTLLNDVSGLSNNQVMQYRVVLQGVTLDYASSDEVDLALYATATEYVRPGEWSSPLDANVPAPQTAYIGLIAKAYNPLPPAMNFSPPAINWTALPDAYNKAYGVLNWTTDPSAAGYNVWESTESALLQLLSPVTPDPDPNASLVTRGATLKALVAANYQQSLQSFSRLNTSSIAGDRIQVELPGNASVLYAYMVSSVSSQGVESQRPPQIAVFGVPQRLVPGQPRLRLRENATGTGGNPAIEVVALAVETGVVPAGYQVFRVRNAALAGDVGLMGPPKILESDPGWGPYTETPLRGGTSAQGMSVVDQAATASWYPYYYRVMALGPDDPANGKYRGKSLASQVQAGYCVPPNAPLIQALSLQTGDGAALLVFTADLPIPPSPLGPALVELVKAAPDTANPGRTVLKVLLSAVPDAIRQGALSLPQPWWLSPTAKTAQSLVADPVTLPQSGGSSKPIAVNRIFPPPPYRGPAFARSVPDAQQQWTLYVLVPYAAGDTNTYSVRLTDPLGRQSSTTF
jgi:hypothetical protein